MAGMSFERIVSVFSVLWFFGGALWLLLSPVGFVRFASLGTRQSLTPSQMKKARILGCVGLALAVIIVLEFLNGYIR
jgi:multisubunit Na+/H+ antiporter MnhG subunit